MIRAPGVYAAVLLGLLGCEPKPANEAVRRSQDQIAALRAKFQALRQQVDAEDLRLAERLFAEIESRTPDAALGPCPVDRASFERDGAPTRRTLKLDMNMPPERLRGPANRQLDETFDLFERKLVEPFFGKDPLAEALDGYAVEPPEGYWFVLVITDIVMPELLDGYEFQPGTLVGEFFVWDAEAKHLICGAPVEATNSDEITTYRRISDKKLDYDLDYARINIDLEENAIESGLATLTKLGPRPVEPPVEKPKIPLLKSRRAAR